MVQIIERRPDGWCVGRSEGQQGVFPASCIQTQFVMQSDATLTDRGLSFSASDGRDRFGSDAERMMFDMMDEDTDSLPGTPQEPAAVPARAPARVAATVHEPVRHKSPESSPSAAAVRQDAPELPPKPPSRIAAPESPEPQHASHAESAQPRGVPRRSVHEIAVRTAHRASPAASHTSSSPALTPIVSSERYASPAPAPSALARGDHAGEAHADTPRIGVKRTPSSNAILMRPSATSPASSPKPASGVASLVRTFSSGNMSIGSPASSSAPSPAPAPASSVSRLTSMFERKS